MNLEKMDEKLAKQCAALLGFGTATVHEAQGQKGALNGALRPVDPSMRLCGPALTVKCRPGDNLALHYALTAALRRECCPKGETLRSPLSPDP